MTGLGSFPVSPLPPKGLLRCRPTLFQPPKPRDTRRPGLGGAWLLSGHASPHELPAGATGDVAGRLDCVDGR